MIDSVREIRAKGSDHATHGRKRLVVTLGDFLAVATPVGKMAKLYGEQARLQGIKATVVTLELVIILLRLAVIAKHAHGPSHGFIVSGYCPGFSARSEIFTRIEAESRCVTNAAGFSPSVRLF